MTRDEAARLLGAAERPVVVAGGGVWWAHAEEELRALVEGGRIPLIVNGMAELPGAMRAAATGDQFGAAPRRATSILRTWSAVSAPAAWVTAWVTAGTRSATSLPSRATASC